MESRIEKAAEFFGKGFNCAQSVVAVFCEKYNMNIDTALKLSGGMGGGFRSGEICGAVSGAVIVIGLKYGQDSTGSATEKQECNKKTIEFIKRFKEQNKYIVCKEILGHNVAIKKEYEQALNKNLFKTTCVDMVKSAVAILEELEY